MEIAYKASEDGTEVGHGTCPHWTDAQTKLKHAHLLDSATLYEPRLSLGVVAWPTSGCVQVST